MEFLSTIPVEVIEGNILPFLEWNDLLRFRRVCKLTKDITEGYMNVHPELAPEIEINEEDKTFRDFLRMSIPTTKIFLNNVSGDEFYENAGDYAVNFLKRFGPLVKHLRVEQISIYIYGKEWDFMESLVNLQSFEARHFGCGKGPVKQWELQDVLVMKHKLAKKRDPRFGKKKEFKYVPNVLKQVKSLKIGNNEDLAFHDIIRYTVGFLTYGRNLEYVSLPFTSDDSLSELRVPDQSALMMAFSLIEFISEKRGSIVPSSALKTLKAIDFRCYPETYLGIPDEEELEMEWDSFENFVRICRFCVEGNIKLMNVPSHWFMRREEFPEIDSPPFGASVVSLVNLHPSVLHLSLGNLERIEIRQTSRSSPGPDWQENRSDWPSLKSLDITIDSKMCSIWEVDPESEMEDIVFFHTAMIKSLYDFLFHGITRPALTELRLNFGNYEQKLTPPKIEDIVSSCPNLKKLTIINWPGTNKALTKLWNGLPELEEVSFENCTDLGNVAFVGRDTGAPVFLKLTKLRKLTLKGLDHMPKITDTLFHLVIRHMKLTHLILASCHPVNKVTQDGIQSLLGGCFANSIENFPFRDWSLADVSIGNFKKIEKMFRSFYMV